MQEIAWLRELIPQAPGMALAVVMVWFFLRHIERRDGALGDTLSKLHIENVEGRKRSHDVIDKCSAALVQNAMATAELIRVQEKMTDLLQDTLRDRESRL